MLLNFLCLYTWILVMGCTIGKEENENGGKLDNTLLPKSVIVDIPPDSQTPSEKNYTLENNQENSKSDTSNKQPKYKTKIDSRVTSKYEIKALIGKGSFSDVLRVDEKTSKQPFAVKVIKVRNEQEEDLFNEELTILQTISHRYVIHLKEVIISKEFNYLVMELATGGELYDRIKSKGCLEEKQSCNITQMMMEGVTYLHKHGVTHRDLKPENILFYHPGKDSKIIITDFGFSKIRKPTLNFSMTTWCGTPEYIAPELLKKVPYSSKVDIWAIGVIVYVMLSGHLPFSADTTPKLFKQIMSASYSFSREVWTTVSSKGKDFIDKLLVVDPMDRCDSIQASAHDWLKTVPPLHKRNNDNRSSRKFGGRQRRHSSRANELIHMTLFNQTDIPEVDRESEVSEETWNNYMRNKASPLYKKQRTSEGNIVLPHAGDFQGNLLTKDTILGDNCSTLSPSNIDSALATEDSNSQMSSQFGMMQVYYYNKFMATKDPEEKRKAKEEYVNHMKGNELTLPIHLPIALNERSNGLLIPKVASLKERKISVHDQFENIDEESEDGNNKSLDLSKLDRIYANQLGGGGSVVSAGSFKSAHIPIETSNASYIEKVGVWLNDSESDNQPGKFQFNQDKYKISNSQIDHLLSSSSSPRTVSVKSNLTTSDQSHSSFNRVVLPNVNQHQQHHHNHQRNNQDEHLKLANDISTHSFLSSVSNGTSSTTGLLSKFSGDGVVNNAYMSDIAINVPTVSTGSSFTSATSFQPLILRSNAMDDA